MYPSNTTPLQLGERREPGLVLLFSMISCGIYYLYFIYKASQEMIAFDGQPDTEPSLELILSVLTCGMYTIYWDFKTAKKIARLESKVGLLRADNALLFLGLNIFGLGMIPSMIEQGSLNDIWYRANQNYAQTGSFYVSDGSPS